MRRKLQFWNLVGLAILPVLALQGCVSMYSHSEFSEYRGEGADQPAQAGGFVKSVNGVDIWSPGLPDRPFTVVGYIQDRYLMNSMSYHYFWNGALEKKMANMAKEKGGSGLIFMGQSSAVLGTSSFAAAQSNTSGSLNANTFGSFSGNTFNANTAGSFSGQSNAFGSGMTTTNTHVGTSWAVIKYKTPGGTP